MMTDDYLWNRQGPPDPDVERLESLLEPLRTELRPLELPTGPRRRMPSLRPVPVLAAAASVLVACLGAWWILRSPVAVPSVELSGLEGTPRAGGRMVTEPVALAEGTFVETRGADRALIQMRGVGQIEVESQSLLRLLRAREGEHRFELERGAIHATVWAPPREFFVETSAGVVVDLGCAYTLEAPGTDPGRLRVTTGLVGLQRGSALVLVPAGSSCSLSGATGPGLPVFDDAGPGFLAAVGTLEAASADAAKRRSALDHVLEHARPVDGVTLWHLLTRLEGEESSEVYERLSALVPPPEGVSLQAVLDGDADALRRWWERLQAGPLRRTNRPQ